MSRALIKLGSTTTEDGQGLEILDFGRCNVFCSENKGADQRCDCRAVDLCLCFSHLQKANFLMTQLKCTWCIENKRKNDLSMLLCTLFSAELSITLGKN